MPSMWIVKGASRLSMADEGKKVVRIGVGWRNVIRPRKRRQAKTIVPFLRSKNMFFEQTDRQTNKQNRLACWSDPIWWTKTCYEIEQ